MRSLVFRAKPDEGLSNGDVNSAKLVWDFFRRLGG